MRIRTKLISAYLGIAILFSCIGFYGIDYTARVGEHFKDLESDTIPSLIALMDIIAATRQASIKALEYHKQGNPEDRAKTLEAVQKIIIGLDSYKSTMVNQAPAQAQHLYGKIDNFVLKIKEYLANTDTKAASIKTIFDLEKQIHDVRRELIHALYPLIDTERQEFRTAADNTYSHIANASTVLLSAIIGVLLISLLAAFFVGRSIVNPINTLNAAAHHVAEGDLKQEIIVRSTDEIGELAASFMHMKNELIKHHEKLEELVKERTVALENSYQELESYSYSIAHDLRTPLRSIISFSQIVMQDASDKLDGENVDHLRRIVKSASHMSELISGILELSRLSRTEMEFGEVNLSEISIEISKNLQDSNPVRNIDWQIQPDLKVMGDRQLLHIVLSNLLGNSWKFTQEKSPAIIEFGITQMGDENVYYIRDNGIGFEMTYVDQIFGLFNRLHRSEEYEGTGIGLATVKRILERHGGWIKAKSEQGIGTTIYFSLSQAAKQLN